MSPKFPLSLTFPISLQRHCHHQPPSTPPPPSQKYSKVYLLSSLRVPCPGKGFRGVLLWPCGSHERVDTACCGEGEPRASGSYPAGLPQCSQAFSSAHHNLSSHTQSERATGLSVRNVKFTRRITNTCTVNVWQKCKAFKDLQAVCQVAVSVRKVRFQFQGCAVRCNGLWDVSRILTVKKPISLKIKVHEVAKNRTGNV